MVSRHQRQRLTYDELDQKSNSLARGLAGIGVKKGDRVAVSLGNSIEYATVRLPLAIANAFVGMRADSSEE